MLIKDLPTAALRKRAMELNSYTLEDLLGAFVWSETEEGRYFWQHCWRGEFDQARRLQPQYFQEGNYLILMNGPAGSGKGEAYDFIIRRFGAQDGRVKKRLHEIASSIFQVPVEFWERREGKEAPNYLLGILPGEVEKLRQHVELPPQEGDGFYKLSPRQALIYVSEVMVKPLLGSDYFGRERLKLISKPGLYVDDSSGFPEELIGLDPKCTAIIQIHGRGEFGPSDTRQYIELPGAHNFKVDNSGSLEEFKEQIERVVFDLLKIDESVKGAKS